MATHHVSLRGACPAPKGVGMHRRASVTSEINPTQAHGTTSKVR
jgi:hypothetical protein